ncbi:hypothetical protein ACFV14_26555 [Streptomyces zaomyceticus]|uniref:hypothetical protein n=1 Tax=Streptomyces zaomyceticus TaxID=68286 RepID=UPI00369341B2
MCGSWPWTTRSYRSPDSADWPPTPEAFVRRGAARHPRLTEALLEQLLSDPDPEVADDAAANPVLRPARMELILAEAGL